MIDPGGDLEIALRQRLVQASVVTAATNGMAAPYCPLR